MTINVWNYAVHPMTYARLIQPPTEGAYAQPLVSRVNCNLVLASQVVLTVSPGELRTFTFLDVVPYTFT